MRVIWLILITIFLLSSCSNNTTDLSDVDIVDCLNNESCSDDSTDFSDMDIVDCLNNDYSRDLKYQCLKEKASNYSEYPPYHRSQFILYPGSPPNKVMVYNDKDDIDIITIFSNFADYTDKYSVCQNAGMGISLGGKNPVRNFAFYCYLSFVSKYKDPSICPFIPHEFSSWGPPADDFVGPDEHCYMYFVNQTKNVSLCNFLPNKVLIYTKTEYRNICHIKFNDSFTEDDCRKFSKNWISCIEEFRNERNIPMGDICDYHEENQDKFDCYKAHKFNNFPSNFSCENLNYNFYIFQCLNQLAKQLNDSSYCIKMEQYKDSPSDEEDLSECYQMVT